MKTISLLALLSLLSCSSTQYFSRTWTDEATGEQMVSDTVLYVRPWGVVNALWEKEPGVKYKIKWGNLLCGAVFAPTYIIPAVMWGFFLFEADRIKEGEYVKLNPNDL